MSVQGWARVGRGRSGEDAGRVVERTVTRTGSWSGKSFNVGEENIFQQDDSCRGLFLKIGFFKISTMSPSPSTRRQPGKQFSLAPLHASKWRAKN